MEFENITLRRNKTIINSPNSSFDSTISEYSSKSLPQSLATGLTYEEFERLKEEIEQLKMQLRTANNEIDNLIMENSTLKKQTLEQQNSIAQLKNLCSGSTNSTIKRSTTLKKRNCKVQNLANITYKKKLDTSFIDLETKSFKVNSTDGAVCNMSKTTITPQEYDPCLKKCVQYKSDGAVLNQHEENKVNTNQILPKTNTKSQLFIFGGQQLSGLATLLIQSRQNSKYENYQIFSTTKPYATTEEILKPIYKLEDSKDNYLIICIGENDTNPNRIIIELVTMLKSFKKTNIIVFKVLQNRYLNESMLNNNLNIMCNNFKNCSFINLECNYPYNKTKHYYLLDACKIINLKIDSHYYDEKFLCYKNMLLRNKVETECSTIPKKGSIPYYFKSIKNIHSGDNYHEVKKNSTSLGKLEMIHNETHKKGTIPYYFKKITPCLTRQSDTQLTSQGKNCFRPKFKI